MKDATEEVLVAVVAALKGAAALTAQLSEGAASIVDRAQEGMAHPFVSIGPTYGAPALEIQVGDGFEVVVTIDTWSRYHGGRLEAARIMSAIADALHDAPLSLSTQTLVWGRMGDQRVIEDPDGVTSHGVQRFTFMTDG